MKPRATRQVGRLGVRASALLALAVAALLAPGVATLAAPLHHDALIEGSGSRTVIFEAGAGDSLAAWKDVQTRVADHCARTFSYTRAGYSGSDMPALDEPRDAATVVRELRAELRQRHIRPPYVLVGHSIGGLFMQYFARNFPSDVSGLVLIDSTHWKQQFVVDPNANVPLENRRTIRLYMPWAMKQELENSGESGLEVQDSPRPRLGEVIVLSSTRPLLNQTEQQYDEEIALQKDLASFFPSSRHQFVANAGHYIQRDQPDVVVSAIRGAAGCK